MFSSSLFFRQDRGEEERNYSVVGEGSVMELECDRGVSRRVGVHPFPTTVSGDP